LLKKTSNSLEMPLEKTGDKYPRKNPKKNSQEIKTVPRIPKSQRKKCGGGNTKKKSQEKRQMICPSVINKEKPE